MIFINFPAFGRAEGAETSILQPGRLKGSWIGVLRGMYSKKRMDIGLQGIAMVNRLPRA